MLNKEQTLVLATLGAGQSFSLFGVVTSDTYVGTVRARTHVEVLQLREADLDAVLADFPLIRGYVPLLLTSSARQPPTSTWVRCGPARTWKCYSYERQTWTQCWLTSLSSGGTSPSSSPPQPASPPPPRGYGVGPHARGSATAMGGGQTSPSSGGMPPSPSPLNPSPPQPLTYWGTSV